MQPTSFWVPDRETIARSQMTQFVGYCAERTGRRFEGPGDFHEFSVSDFRSFWRLFLQWVGLPCQGNPDRVCTSDDCERAFFFPDLRLNYADILLPATTQLEHRDIVKPYGHYYLMYNEPSIPPLGESKPNWEVFALLAEKMGFEDQCFKDTDEDIIRQALLSRTPEFEGITLERLKQQGFARLNLPEVFSPFAQGGFSTPSGKCEFYSEQMKLEGFDPLPAYIPPRESPESAPELAERYPIQLLSPPAQSFLNSSFSHLPTFIRDERQPSLEISSEDASERGITTGDHVRVYNDRGECRLMARVSPRVKPGVAVAPSIWWKKLSPDGANINATTSQDLTDLGGGACFYDNLVQIERCS